MGEEINKIESEYASEAIDDVVESLADSKNEDDKDDDLSLAQSQFIESGRLDENKKSREKSKDKQP